MLSSAWTIIRTCCPVRIRCVDVQSLHGLILLFCPCERISVTLTAAHHRPNVCLSLYLSVCPSACLYVGACHVE